MKRSIIILATGWLLTSAAWAQKAWSLDDCIAYAKENNVTLKQAYLNARSAEEDVKGSRGALLPSISASTNQSVGYRPWENSGTATVSNGLVETKVEKGYYNGSYGVNAQWTVWNGNRNYNQLKQNKLTALQAERQAEVTANSIQEQIAQLYVQILYLNETLKVNEQSLETSRKNEERGRQMLEVGKMSRADVAQLTAQRAADEYNVVEARTNIARYKLQLQQLMELDTDPETEFMIQDPKSSDEEALEALPNVQQVYQQALASRPEIAQTLLGMKNSQLSVKMAKAGYLPTLSLNAGVGTSTNSLSDKTWGRQMKTNFDASAGVTLSIPIFDGRQTKTNIRKARIQEELSTLEYQNAQDDLYWTIENYWLDAQTNQQKFRTAIETEKSEQESYNLLQEQFQLGLKNIVELMTGKDKLLAAQQNKLQSKYQTLLAQQMLKFYSGK